MSKIISVDYKPLRDAVNAKKEQWGNLRALEEEIDVSYSALSRFLAGADPSTINLLRLCDYVGMPVGDLAQREPPPKPARARRPAGGKEARP